MTTGERIKERRKALGMTQEELGRKLGVQKAAISKMEKNIVVNLKRDVISSLCEALDCSPSYLMGWDEEDEHARSISAAVDLLNRLSDEQLMTVLELLRQLTSGRA